MKTRKGVIGRSTERMEKYWGKRQTQRAGESERDGEKSCEMGGGSADSEGLLTEAEG